MNNIISIPSLQRVLAELNSEGVEYESRRMGFNLNCVLCPSLGDEFRQASAFYSVSLEQICEVLLMDFLLQFRQTHSDPVESLPKLIAEYNFGTLTKFKFPAIR